MKKFLSFSMVLLNVLRVSAQNPCQPRELTGISVQYDSPCEAYHGTSHYYNFVTLTTIRNFQRTGTLQWQYRLDTINGAWLNLPSTWQGLGTDQVYLPDFTIADNGQYRCIFTDTVTGCKDYRRVNVNVFPRPQIAISVDSVKCDGMYLGIDLFNDPTQNLTYCWQPDLSGQTNNCEGTSPAFLFDRVGCVMVSGVVTVKVTNQYGCENLIYTSGLCNQEYMDLYTQANDEDSVFCSKTASLQAARFSSASLQNGWTYQWKKNGSNLSWATSYLIKPVVSGTYSCVVTNNAGCTFETNPVPVTVYPVPSVNLQPAGTTQICTNTSLTFQSGAAPGNTCNWYRNNLPLTSGSDTLAVSVAGNYKVIVTNAYGCSSTSKVSNVNVYRSVSSANGPVIFCNGDSVVLQNYTPTSVSWQWQKNAVSIPGATFPTFAAKQSGLYRAKTTSAAGCISYSNQIDVSVNCREANEATAHLHVYPVPSSDFIDISIPEEFRNHSILQLTDLSGKIISVMDISGSTSQQIIIRHLAPGVYFVRLQSDRSAAIGKIVRM